MKRVERNGLRVVPQLEDVIGKPLGYKIHLADMPATKFLDSPAYQALYNNGQAIETYDEFKARRSQFEDIQKQVARDLHVPVQHVKETVSIAVGTGQLQGRDASTETEEPDVDMGGGGSPPGGPPDGPPGGSSGGSGGSPPSGSPGGSPGGSSGGPRGNVQEGGSSGSNQPPPPGAPGAGRVWRGGALQRRPDWYEQAANERPFVRQMIEIIEGDQRRRNTPQMFTLADTTGGPPPPPPPAAGAVMMQPELVRSNNEIAQEMAYNRLRADLVTEFFMTLEYERRRQEAIHAARE